MMEHFQLESPHRGPYVPGTVSTQARTAAVFAQVDKVLETFDGTDNIIDVSVAIANMVLDSKSE